MRFEIEVQFDKGYIADPYWPEREKLINIQKESGINRARSSTARDAALKSYLETHGLTMGDYEGLERLAKRPFYMQDGQIVIPAHQVYGCLAKGCDVATSSLRLTRAEQLRTMLHASDWITPKTGPDGIWERMVVVTSGTGAKLSNQRALRTNAYIADFCAVGTMKLLTGGEDDKLTARLKDFLSYVGREVGIGASRKMDWGRFEVVRFERQL